MKNYFNKTLKILREKSGFTQKDIADRIGVSDKAVSKWERGLSIPDVAYLRKLSLLLDSDVDELLAGNIIVHNAKWLGIIKLENISYANRLLYDKELIMILLSYFFLVKITNILIISNEKIKNKISKIIAEYKIKNVNITYISEKYDFKKDELSILNKFSNTMLLYKEVFTYGVGFTKFLQKAMVDNTHFITLALPAAKNNNKDNIDFDSEKKVFFSQSQTNKKYNFSIYPMLFFPTKEIEKVLNKNSISNNIINLIKHNEMYCECLDRGFISINILKSTDINDISQIIRIIKKYSDLDIYNINEIAYLRGIF